MTTPGTNGYAPSTASGFAGQQRNPVSPSAPPITVDDVIKELSVRSFTKIFTTDQITELARSFTNHDVDDIHRHADLDLSKTAMHHTLGPSDSKASPGGHNHDGGTSVLLLDGIVITGSRSTATASVLQQVITALVQLGVTDTTSA